MEEEPIIGDIGEEVAWAYNETPPVCQLCHSKFCDFISLPLSLGTSRLLIIKCNNSYNNSMKGSL